MSVPALGGGGVQLISLEICDGQNDISAGFPPSFDEFQEIKESETETCSVPPSPPQTCHQNQMGLSTRFCSVNPVPYCHSYAYPHIVLQILYMK
jgi:hypothetical protein